MKESIGTSYLVMLVAIFISIIGGLIVVAFSYSRAYKTKNKMVDIIEKYEGYNSKAAEEITQYLRQVGYNVRRKSNTCPDLENGTLLNDNGNLAYCVYEFSTNRGKYYIVNIFMNLNIPILSDLLELRVKGQSRTIYDL